MDLFLYHLLLLNDLYVKKIMFPMIIYVCYPIPIVLCYDLMWSVVLQYCEYYPGYDKCKQWLEKNLPEMFQKLMNESECWCLVAVLTFSKVKDSKHKIQLNICLTCVYDNTHW